MQTHKEPWTRYSEQKPTEAGLYEWRVPSKAVPGMTLIVAAEMRMRGAGYERVLSPKFDYWDGYRVHVLCDVEWRHTDFIPGKHQRTPAILSVEGLELSPCSHCGSVPSIEAHQRDSFGVTIGPDPWNLNSWQFNCCSWGRTPSMDDPRKIERIRRDTRGKAAPELLIALIDCVTIMENELKGLSVIQPEIRQARAAIAKATGGEV